MLPLCLSLRDNKRSRLRQYLIYIRNYLIHISSFQHFLLFVLNPTTVWPYDLFNVLCKQPEG